MPGDKVFLDTNVIIYAYDTSAGNKHEIAQKIMFDLWDSGLGVISAQVLQEFFVSVTQRIPKPLDVDSSTEIISDLLKWDVVVNDGEIILEAIEIHKNYKYSFWDSMIVKSAIRGGCATFFLEHNMAVLIIIFWEKERSWGSTLRGENQGHIPIFSNFLLIFFHLNIKL